MAVRTLGYSFNLYTLNPPWLLATTLITCAACSAPTNSNETVLWASRCGGPGWPTKAVEARGCLVQEHESMKATTWTERVDEGRGEAHGKDNQVVLLDLRKVGHHLHAPGSLQGDTGSSAGIER